MRLTSRLVLAWVGCLLAACDSSPTDPTGATGEYALVRWGDVTIPMALVKPAGWQGLYCSDLVQSQVLTLRRDRTASLFTRSSFQCEDGRAPVPDSTRSDGTYRATADSVIVLFSSGASVDGVASRMTRAGDRLVDSLGPIYTPDGVATADTFRLVYQKR